jgi:hypothetical protein
LPSATATKQSDRTFLFLILAIALALRLAAAFLLPDQHFSDAEGYRTAGQQLWAAGGASVSGYATRVMPLYPLLVGLTGPGWGQLAMDIAVSTAAVWLVYRLALAIFADNAAALLAALMAAIYPYFIFYAVVGLTETLYITLLLGAFACWYGGAFTLAAVLAVLSILTRPSIDLLAPLLVLYFALAVHRLPVRAAVRHLAIYAVVYVALLSPWWLHNYRAYGSFVRLNLGVGHVLYSGNNPLNRSGGGVHGVDVDFTPFDKISDPLARDRALWNAGVAYIIEHPGRFLELAGLKFVRFWALWPYAREYSRPLYVVASLLSFGPVLILTIVYLVGWGWRERIRIAPILAWGAYLTAVHMVMIGSVRYRLPLEPFMIVFAAVALVRLARRVGRPWAESPGPARTLP